MLTTLIIRMCLYYSVVFVLFSVVFVNASVFFTYSRFTDTLLERQRLHAENTLQSQTRIRRYFR